MAALAYLLLPVSGLAAFLLARDARIRWHGLQAVALGLLWPLLLYAASAVSPAVTRAVFAAGALVWLGFLVAAGLGADPRLPMLGVGLREVAESDPRE